MFNKVDIPILGWHQEDHRGAHSSSGDARLAGCRDPAYTTAVKLPLSILDLAQVSPGQTISDALAGSVALARQAENSGYRRVWYAEHHNIASIASSAPAVLIAHVAAQTGTIRLGAGGVMLPNHAPLTVAEQFGTLAALHPNRIDLGLGRAPGSDPPTMRALRSYEGAVDRFPEDVIELQGYLSGETVVPGVLATPGSGSAVPLYILGSSLFGGELAAALGLPFAFASHFAPQSLLEAVAGYRRRFRPSPQLARPYVLAGFNVMVADRRSVAEAEFEAAQRFRVRVLLGRGQALTDGEADALLQSPGGQRIRAMSQYAAYGTPDEVGPAVQRFAELAQADELLLIHATPHLEARLRSAQLLASAMETLHFRAPQPATAA